MREFLLGYGLFATYYVAIANGVFFILTLMSINSVLKIIVRSRYSKFENMSGSQYVPPISILVPAFNEEITIIESIKSLLALNYPSYEVIVVNDGSKDNTINILLEEFGLKSSENIAVRNILKTKEIKGVYYNSKYPKLIVIDKYNGGKADSLNVGINFSHYPLIASIDADSLLERDALIRITQAYMENPDEIIAIGGNVKIANGCTIENGMVNKVRLPKKILPMLQSIEYIKAFLGGRIGWSSVNGLFIVSGAFGVFKKEHVIKVGGYRAGSPGEDMNIIIKLHKYMIEQKRKYKIAFCPDAICWTQAPDTLRILSSQRKRWGRGTLKNMMEYKFMFLNPKYKLLGVFIIPFIVIFNMIEPYFRITGFLAIIGYCMTDLANINILIIFTALTFAITLLLGLSSLILEEITVKRYLKISDIFRLIWNSLILSIVLDPLVVIWTILGHIQLLRKNNSWGTMTRQSWSQ